MKNIYIFLLQYYDCTINSHTNDHQHGFHLQRSTEVIITTDIDKLCSGNSGVPWRKCSDLGFICAVGVGDLLNVGHPVVVVVSGCGWLNILDLHQEAEDVGDQKEIR